MCLITVKQKINLLVSKKMFFFSDKWDWLNNNGPYIHTLQVVSSIYFPIFYSRICNSLNFINIFFLKNWKIIYVGLKVKLHAHDQVRVFGAFTTPFDGCVGNLKYTMISLKWKQPASYSLCTCIWTHFVHSMDPTIKIYVPRY